MNYLGNLNDVARKYLEQGNVAEFNALRHVNPYWLPDLPGVVVSNKSLTGINLEGTMMQRSTLVNVTINSPSNLRDINISGSQLNNFNIDGIDVGRGNFQDVKADEKCSFKNVSINKGAYERSSHSVRTLWERDNPGKAEELGFKRSGKIL